MTSSLHPCPACQRHILSTEKSCPFCATETDFSEEKVKLLPTRRMSRAALVALSTLAAAAPAAACGGDTDDRDAPGDGDGDMSGDGDGDMSGDGDGDAVGPVYGIPATGGSDGLGGSGMGGEEASGGSGGMMNGSGGDLVGPVYGIPSDPE